VVKFGFRENSDVHVQDVHGMECPLQSSFAARDNVEGAKLDLGGEVFAFASVGGVGW